MTGMGMMKRAKSVATFTPTMTYHTVLKFMQWPGIALFPNDSTGVQTSGNMMESVTAHALRKTRKPRATCRRED